LIQQGVKKSKKRAVQPPSEKERKPVVERRNEVGEKGRNSEQKPRMTKGKSWGIMTKDRRTDGKKEERTEG
jgi:hypothetical protein